MNDFAASLIFIVLYGLSFGMVLFAISIGLVITMGLMRVVNMAHGFFAALGAYVTVWMMFQQGAPLWLVGGGGLRRRDVAERFDRTDFDPPALYRGAA